MLVQLRGSVWPITCLVLAPEGTASPCVQPRPWLQRRPDPFQATHVSSSEVPGARGLGQL